MKIIDLQIIINLLQIKKIETVKHFKIAKRLQST